MSEKEVLLDMERKSASRRGYSEAGNGEAAAAREEIRQQEDEEFRLLTSHGYESLQNSYDLWYSIILPARVEMVELGVSVSCKK